jgi:hypothetical protein
MNPGLHRLIRNYTEWIRRTEGKGEMGKYSMKEVMDESRDAGDCTVRVRAYIPDLGEQDNNLPCLFSIEAGYLPVKWTLIDWTQGAWLIGKARRAFDQACHEHMETYRARLRMSRKDGDGR